MKSLDIGKIAGFQREFVRQRKWRKYHTPKNLSIALAVEAAELMEIFQWLNDSESKRIMADRAKGRAVEDELADVFYYLIRLADTLGVDLEAAFWQKMRQNAAKYPVRLARGNARKYTEFAAARQKTKRAAKP